MIKKLVVIPSDPISAYEKKGTSSWLEEYYNPQKYFDEVFVLSPKEDFNRDVYGLKIRVVKSNNDFKEKLRKIKPICVRAYGGYWATDYANLNRVYGIPVISSVHDTNPKLLYKSIKYSDFVISMSDVIKEILKNRFSINSSKIAVLGNRVDPDVFKEYDSFDKDLLTVKQELPFDKFILLVGRKTEQKNIDTVLKAMPFIDQNYGLVLVGKGDFDEFKDLIENLKIQNRVHNIEKIENNLLPIYFNLATVLCNPSRWEGFGLVFLEAVFCKCKIVTSNIAPMNEFVFNNKTMNYLVDNYEEPKEIAKAINYLLTKQKEVDQKNYDFVLKKYSKKEVNKNEVWCYKSVKFDQILFFKRFSWQLKIRLKKSTKLKKIKNKLCL